MSNTHFSFKQFTIHQEHCAMKVSTDACTFGAWIAEQIGQPSCMLDIGAGTGLLSLMVAQLFLTDIDALEIEAGCFGQLCDNLKASPWKEHLHPIHGDLLHFTPDKQYDAIVCNPPFYEKQLESPDSNINLARHASRLTLPVLFSQVDRLLKPSGSFYLLMPFYRKLETMETAVSHGFHPHAVCDLKHRDGHQAFRSMFLFDRKEKARHEESISVYTESKSYSTRFDSLMQDYYLYL